MQERTSTSSSERTFGICSQGKPLRLLLSFIMLLSEPELGKRPLPCLAATFHLLNPVNSGIRVPSVTNGLKLKLINKYSCDKIQFRKLKLKSISDVVPRNLSLSIEIERQENNKYALNI